MDKRLRLLHGVAAISGPAAWAYSQSIGQRGRENFADEVVVTAKRDSLLGEISRLVEASQSLQDVLNRYERAITDLAERVRKGESVLEAFSGMDGAMERHRELPETLDDFEAARHQVRVALFDLALDQGATASELGRRLGVSRQLASRLAGHAREKSNGLP